MHMCGRVHVYVFVCRVCVCVCYKKRHDKSRRKITANSITQSTTKARESNTFLLVVEHDSLQKCGDSFVQRLTNRVLYYLANYSRSMHNL